MSVDANAILTLVKQSADGWQNVAQLQQQVFKLSNELAKKPEFSARDFDAACNALREIAENSDAFSDEQLDALRTLAAKI